MKPADVFQLFRQHPRATDVFLTPGEPPALRENGKITHLEKARPLSMEAIREFLDSVLRDDQWLRLMPPNGGPPSAVDFAIVDPQETRYRVNAFPHSKPGANSASLSASIRRVNSEILSLEKLGFSPRIRSQFLNRRKGLILVTGPASSGKSTTIASMVDHINTTSSYHIITVEDPVEVLHRNKQSLIHQREVPKDTPDFAQAIRDSLRQSPDVIVVGEMRDAEVMKATLRAAETGHLVLATMHTPGAVQAILRLQDAFPAEERASVRAILAFHLEAVISQVLIYLDGNETYLAYEAFEVTHAVRNLIRIGDDHLIPNHIVQQGFRTINQHLEGLVHRGALTPEQAARYSPDPKSLEQNMRE